MICTCGNSEIGKCRRWAIYLVSVLETVIFGGAIFGFAQLVFVLKKEGVYSHLCINNENTTLTEKVLGCEAQDENFALIYTVSCTLFGLPSILVGYSLHHLGLAVTRIMAGLMLAIGFFFMGLITADASDWLYAGMILIAMGGNQIRMSGLQSANLFPSYRSTALSIISGAFSASAGVFVFIEWASENGFGLRYSFWILACIAALIIPSTFMMPCNHIPYNDQGTSNESSEDQAPLKDSLFSLSSFTFFYWYTICLSAAAIFGTYYNPWISDISTTIDEASFYSKIYSGSMFLCPLVPPTLGLVMDFINKRSVKKDGHDKLENKIQELKSAFLPLTFITLVEVVMYSCLLVHEPWAIYVGLAGLVICRPGIVGVGTAYVRIRFPVYHFNRLIGIWGTLLSSLTMLNFLQFRWGQYHYESAQLFMVCIIALGLMLPGHLLVRSYQEKVAKKQIQASIKSKVEEQIKDSNL